MSEPTDIQPTTLPLPFAAWGGQKVTESKFSLSGSITHPEAQPPVAYTMAGERHVFVVVAYTDGQATKPTGPEGGHELVWENRLKVSEAFELSDAELAERIVEQLRDEVRQELGQLVGPEGEGLGDEPQHRAVAS